MADCTLHILDNLKIGKDMHIVFPMLMYLKILRRDFRKFSTTQKFIPSFFNPNWFQLLLSSVLNLPFHQPHCQDFSELCSLLLSFGFVNPCSGIRALGSLFIVTEKGRQFRVLSGLILTGLQKEGRRPTTALALTSQSQKYNNHFINKVRMLKMSRF